MIPSGKAPTLRAGRPEPLNIAGVGKQRRALGLERARKGQAEMADDFKRFRFVAGVFREPEDLDVTVAGLRSERFVAGQLLVVANHRAADVRKLLDAHGRGDVLVLPAQVDGSVKLVSKSEFPPGITAILRAMNHTGRGGEGVTVGAADHQSQVYAQLCRDVAGGALVLIANVADSEEQLLGARIMLRGNCECVLTHEITATSASSP